MIQEELGKKTDTLATLLANIADTVVVVVLVGMDLQPGVCGRHRKEQKAVAVPLKVINGRLVDWTY